MGLVPLLHKVPRDTAPSSLPATTLCGVALVFIIWNDTATTCVWTAVSQRVENKAKGTSHFNGRSLHASKDPSLYILLANLESIATANCKVCREMQLRHLLLCKKVEQILEEIKFKRKEEGDIFWAGNHIRERLFRCHLIWVISFNLFSFLKIKIIVLS